MKVLLGVVGFLLSGILLHPAITKGGEYPLWCSDCEALAQMQELFGDSSRTPNLLVELEPWAGCEAVDSSRLGTGQPTTCSVQAAIDYLAESSMPQPVDGTLLIGVTARGDSTSNVECRQDVSVPAGTHGRSGGGAKHGSIVMNNPTPYPLVLAFCGVELTASAADRAVISVSGGGSPISLIGARLSGGTDNAPEGLLLESTSNVSLRDLRLENFADFAIRGRDVANLILSRVTVTGSNGDSTADDEGSVALENLQGSATISNSTLEGGHEDNLRIVSRVGRLDLVIRDTLIGANGTESGNAGVVIEVSGHANARVSIEDNQFTSSRGDHLRLSAVDQATTQWIVRDNHFSNRHPNTVSGGGGVTLSASGRGARVEFDISHNTFQDSLGTALNLHVGSGQARASGRVTSNRIGRTGERLSGSAQGSGVQVTATGGGSQVVTIRNNDIRQYNETGVSLLANNGTAQLDVTMTGNTLAEPGGFAYAGLALTAGDSDGDRVRTCLDLGGPGDLANSILGSGPPPVGDFLVTVGTGGALTLPGFDPEAADAYSYFQARNAGAPQGGMQAEPGRISGLPPGRVSCETSADPAPF